MPRWLFARQLWCRISPHRPVRYPTPARVVLQPADGMPLAYALVGSVAQITTGKHSCGGDQALRQMFREAVHALKESYERMARSAMSFRRKLAKYSTQVAPGV